MYMDAEFYVVQFLGPGYKLFMLEYNMVELPLNNCSFILLGINNHSMVTFKYDFIVTKST